MSLTDAEREELAALRAKTAASEPPTSPPPEFYAAQASAIGQAVAAEVKYALTGWGPQIHQTFDIRCPSGQWCKANQITIEDAISLGLLDSLDMFTNNLMAPVLAGEEDGPEEDNNKQILNALKDPEKRASFFGVVNRVIAHAVQEPAIVLSTNDDGSVNDGEVFASDVPFADKMHIFRRVFGGANPALEQFQPGQEAVVAAVADVAGVQVPTE